MSPTSKFSHQNPQMVNNFESQTSLLAIFLSSKPIKFMLPLQALSIRSNQYPTIVFYVKWILKDILVSYLGRPLCLSNISMANCHQFFANRLLHFESRQISTSFAGDFQGFEDYWSLIGAIWLVSQSEVRKLAWVYGQYNVEAR